MNAVTERPLPVAGEPRLLIDGRLTEARSGARYPNISPVTEQVIGTVADADVDDAAAAIAAARRAFDDDRVVDRPRAAPPVPYASCAMACGPGWLSFASRSWPRSAPPRRSRSTAPRAAGRWRSWTTTWS